MNESVILSKLCRLEAERQREAATAAAHAAAADRERTLLATFSEIVTPLQRALVGKTEELAALRQEVRVARSTLGALEAPAAVLGQTCAEFNTRFRTRVDKVRLHNSALNRVVLDDDLCGSFCGRVLQ